MNKEFVTYKQALALKELGFDEPCFTFYEADTTELWDGEEADCSGLSYKQYNSSYMISAPLYQQAINFLYICSNKQIDIELKGSDTYEERVRKINQGCEDLRNLQNNKSNQ